LYGHGEKDGEPRKVRFEDLGELRKQVWRLVEEDAVEVDWTHIFGARHHIGLEEIITTLVEGRYEFHQEVEDRFVALYDLRPFAFAVIFEVLDYPEKRVVAVLTAFRSHPRLGRG
jgi:hypothetical protein